MRISIEAPEGIDALTEFVLFHDRVYAERPVRWPAAVGYQLPLLTGESPSCLGRAFRPLVARDGGRIVARVCAMLDRRYEERWGEPLGHLLFFEAVPGTRDAVRSLLDEACSWLRSQGAEAARTGFASTGEFPYSIDDYETLPPLILRQTPVYYHALLKDAGFETEKGMVDYRAEARPDLLARWESAVEAATRAGYELVALEDVPAQTRARDFGTAWNEAFHNHWGAVAFTEQEFGSLFSLQEPLGTLAYSLIAYRDSEPAGVVWVTPDPTALAQRAPGREIRPEERVNTLGIGVRAPHRGRGVNMALASSAFLALAKRGQTYMSYTLVLDDNRPSRRTAEKLGASVCANYVAYRRNFQTRRQRRRHQ